MHKIFVLKNFVDEKFWWVTAKKYGWTILGGGGG